jgi:alpha-galactosidase
LVTLKLAGLDPDLTYQSGGENFGGDELMQLGLYIDPHLAGDYATQRFHFVAKVPHE